MNNIARPPKLATLLMRHHYENRNLKTGESAVLKLEKFISSNPAWEHNLDIGYLFHIVNQLVSQGLLIDLGGVGLERLYLQREFSEVNAEYGVYENRVGGPIEIFRRHSESVTPVVVKDHNNDFDLGTGFYFGNRNTFITARHVVENKKSIKILDSKGNSQKILGLSYHFRNEVDLAIFLVEAEATTTAPPFRKSSHVLGESILSIGFPPVPGFDRLTVLEHGEVGSEIKVMNGEVVSEGEPYHEDTEYFLVNARVKGGSSGAPVLNRDGFVVGVVASTAISTASSDKLEGLGYGIVTPARYLNDLLLEDHRVDAQFENLGCNNEIKTLLL